MLWPHYSIPAFTAHFFVWAVNIMLYLGYLWVYFVEISSCGNLGMYIYFQNSPIALRWALVLLLCRKMVTLDRMSVVKVVLSFLFLYICSKIVAVWNHATPTVEKYNSQNKNFVSSNSTTTWKSATIFNRRVNFSVLVAKVICTYFSPTLLIGRRDNVADRRRIER